jgi:hypothetical protein
MMTGLINLTNLPKRQVSGLNDEELEWVTNQSSDRYIVELDPTMFNELLEDYTNADQEEEEYKDLDDEVMREMDQAELEGIQRQLNLAQSSTSSLNHFCYPKVYHKTLKKCQQLS